MKTKYLFMTRKNSVIEAWSRSDQNSFHKNQNSLQNK